MIIDVCYLAINGLLQAQNTEMLNDGIFGQSENVMTL